MSFFEVEFPRGIGYHRLGSPSGFFTTINEAFSGQEQRNQNRGYARGKWTVTVQTPPANQFAGPGGGEGPRRQSFAEILLAFHLNVAGKAGSFRLKDHLDYSFAGQIIGVGTGSETIFQLIKSYTIGGRSYVRNITKPITSGVSDYQGHALANTVTLALNGSPTTAWTLAHTTGLVTFTTAPGAGVVITAPTGEFHFPVRFDVDELPVEVLPSNVGGGTPVISVNAVPLVETLPPNY